MTKSNAGALSGLDSFAVCILLGVVPARLTGPITVYHSGVKL